MNIFIRTALITLVVFIAGIFFGLFLGNERVSSLEQSVTELNAGISNAELQFLFLDVMEERIPCSYLMKEADDLGRITDSMGREVENYEYSDKITEKNFIELKKKYTSVLIRNWLTLEKIKTTCDGDYTTILYFYSRTECEKCTDQGIILSYLKDKLGGKIMTFAIDGEIGLNIVEGLKEVYNVSSYPTLIINNEEPVGFMGMDELKAALCEEDKSLEICSE